MCGPHLINWFRNSVSACIILVLSIFFCVLITLSVICQHIVRHSIKFGWAVESGWSTFVHYLGFFIFLLLFSPVCVHVLRVWLNFHSYPWKHVTHRNSFRAQSLELYTCMNSIYFNDGRFKSVATFSHDIKFIIFKQLKLFGFHLANRLLSI